jgi:hypothetical protein
LLNIGLARERAVFEDYKATIKGKIATKQERESVKRIAGLTIDMFVKLSDGILD